MQQHHTACSTVPSQHTSCYSTCAHTQLTNKPYPYINQPTNQPTSQTQHPMNQPTNDQPTNPKINCQQTNKAGCNAHMGGGGIHNLGGGGTKHTTTTLTQPVGGHSLRGVAREEGWWEAVTCTTPQAHTAGRRERVTHLPVNACPRRSHFSSALSKKSHTYKKEIDTPPSP